WNRSIRRCLDPSPAKRFPRATAAVDALRPARWPLAILAALALLVLGYFLRAARIRPPRAVAMLPFVIRHGEVFPSSLLDHVAEQVQNNPVLRQKWLVFPPGEVRSLRVTNPAQAKTVLGATHVLTGSLISESDSVTISGQLIDTASMAQIASFQKTCP